MRKLTDVYAGALLYRRLTKGKDDTFFVLLPDDDAELNYYALMHLERCARLKGFSSAMALCRSSMCGALAPYAGERFPVTGLSDKELEALSAYVLLKFTAGNVSLLPNMRTVSLQEDTLGYDMLADMHVFDKEYLVWNMMLFSINEYGEMVRTTPFPGRQRE